MTRRGFTLVELMIGMAIGAFTVLVAAHVATVVVQQAARGRQATDFNSRARVIGRQIRTDIRLTGVGSTGAVTADQINQPWNMIFSQQSAGGLTPNGANAFPAIIGADNYVGGVLNVVPSSDVMMMVVPNPAKHAVTDQISESTTVILFMGPADLTPFNDPTCDMVYIVDHSTPSGSGRAQIANKSAVAGTTLVLDDALQFTVAPQSDVMCARVSTYWVEDTDGDGVGNQLNRSDLRRMTMPTPLAGGVVIQPPLVAGDDVIAPGVMDLQIAYAFSAEIFVKRGLAPDPANQWAYAATGTLLPNFTNDFFETRMVRFNIQARRNRAVDPTVSLTTAPRAENGGAAFTNIARSLQPETLTSAETLVNLRYFDFGTPSGVAAEPY